MEPTTGQHPADEGQPRGRRHLQAVARWYAEAAECESALLAAHAALDAARIGVDDTSGRLAAVLDGSQPTWSDFDGQRLLDRLDHADLALETQLAALTGRASLLRAGKHLTASDAADTDFAEAFWRFKQRWLELQEGRESVQRRIAQLRAITGGLEQQRRGQRCARLWTFAEWVVVLVLLPICLTQLAHMLGADLRRYVLPWLPDQLAGLAFWQDSQRSNARILLCFCVALMAWLRRHALLRVGRRWWRRLQDPTR